MVGSQAEESDECMRSLSDASGYVRGFTAISRQSWAARTPQSDNE